MPVPAIILAAGASRRLGQPKQLLSCRGETLLNRAIRVAEESGASPVLAVLGAHSPDIAASIQSPTAIKVHNDHWQLGMSTSIHAALRALDAIALHPPGVLLMSCDQPRLTADHLRSLLAAFAAHASPIIVASSYAEILGVPAIFPRETFPQLLAVQGDKGARSIIERAPCPVLPIAFEGGDIDIDSPKDISMLE